jgi:hypothetical protein
MNKKSELLVRRKNVCSNCLNFLILFEERELRVVFETLVTFCSHNLDPTSSEQESPRINLSGLQQITEEIQRNSQHMKDSPGLSRSLIASFSEPYDLAERVWNILDPNEVRNTSCFKYSCRQIGSIDVHSFIAICLPILLSRGGKGNIAHILASPIPPTLALSPLVEIDGRWSDQSIMYQFLKYGMKYPCSHIF